MSISNYKDLRVWQRSVAFVTGVYRFTSAFPSSERFGIISQMRRAVISIQSNIAEGNGRSTTGEYLHQLSVAQGSLNEVEALLIVSRNLEFASESQVEPLERAVAEIGPMLTGLRKALQRRKRK